MGNYKISIATFPISQCQDGVQRIKDVTVFKDVTENFKTRQSLTTEGTNVTEIMFFFISLGTN